MTEEQAVESEIGTGARLTYADVAKACWELTGRGVPITMNALRQHIGRGSDTTIHKHLKRWREAAKDQPLLATAGQPPAELAQAAASLWEVALATATARLNAEREAMAEEVQRADDRAAAAARRLDLVERELSLRNEQLAERGAALAERIREIETMRAQIETERRLASEAVARESAALDASRNAFVAALEDLRASNRAEVAVANQRADRAIADLEAAEAKAEARIREVEQASWQRERAAEQQRTQLLELIANLRTSRLEQLHSQTGQAGTKEAPAVPLLGSEEMQIPVPLRRDALGDEAASIIASATTKTFVNLDALRRGEENPS